MTPITGITTSPLLQPARAAGGAGAVATQGTGGPGPSFKDFLVQSIQDVNSMQTAADKAVEKLATGGDVNPAEVLTAVQKADIAFQMMIQVRNKLVDAFTEIKNLQI
jgi:flagellar hook-basal body complex protein FliE